MFQRQSLDGRCDTCTEKTIIQEASKKLRRLQSKSSNDECVCDQDVHNRNIVLEPKAVMVEIESCSSEGDSFFHKSFQSKKPGALSRSVRIRGHTLSLSGNVLEIIPSRLQPSPPSSASYISKKTNKIQKSLSLRTKSDLNSNQTFFAKYLPQFKDANSKSLDALCTSEKQGTDNEKLMETQSSCRSEDILSESKDMTETMDLEELVLPGNRVDGERMRLL